MRVNRKEERMSRLVQREDLRGVFIAMPWIERGRFFRFMKRQRWNVRLSISGMHTLFGIYVGLSVQASRGADMLFPKLLPRFMDELEKGKTIEQIKEEGRLFS